MPRTVSVLRTQQARARAADVDCRIVRIAADRGDGPKFCAGFLSLMLLKAAEIEPVRSLQTR
jgi:hypothetical protein